MIVQFSVELDLIYFPFRISSFTTELRDSAVIVDDSTSTKFQFFNSVVKKLSKRIFCIVTTESEISCEVRYRSYLVKIYGIALHIQFLQIEGLNHHFQRVVAVRVSVLGSRKLLFFSFTLSPPSELLKKWEFWDVKRGSVSPNFF